MKEKKKFNNPLGAAPILDREGMLKLFLVSFRFGAVYILELNNPLVVLQCGYTIVVKTHIFRSACSKCQSRNLALEVNCCFDGHSILDCEASKCES